jgi:hypothetical protein
VQSRFFLGTLALLIGRFAIAFAAATCIACNQQGDHYQSRSQDCVSWTTYALHPTHGSMPAQGGEFACAGYVPRASLEQMLQR